MTVPYVYTNLVDGPVGSGGSVYAAATWNGRYQTLYDGVNAHVTNATVGSATAQNHLFAHILSAGNMPLTSPPLRNPGEANYAIDMILLALANITGTVTGSNFSTITYPTTLSAVNTALANFISGAQITGAAAAVKGPTAGRLLVGAGASAMTELAPGTSGNVAQSNGTTWVSAAFAPATAIGDGTLSFTKVANGYVSGSGLVLTAAQDIVYSAGGQMVSYAGGTFTYSGGSSPPTTGALQWRTDLVYLTPAGVLTVAPGTISANLAAAQAAAPSVYSISGYPKAFVDCPPSMTSIANTGTAGAGIAVIRDARIVGPIPQTVAGNVATGIKGNSSNAQVSITDTGLAAGTINLIPTGGMPTTSASDVVLSGSAKFVQRVTAYTPTANESFFHVGDAGGVTAASRFANWQGLRKALMSISSNNNSNIDTAALRVDFVQQSNPSGLGTGIGRSGIVAQGFTQPDNGGDTSVYFGMMTGGGSAATFYKWDAYRTLGFYPYHMAAQGAVEAGTDGGSQVHLIMPGLSPAPDVNVGANGTAAATISTVSSGAILTTDTALYINVADIANIPIPGGIVVDGYSYPANPQTYPAICFLRIGTDTTNETIAYTAINASTGALTLATSAGNPQILPSTNGRGVGGSTALAWAANSPVWPVYKAEGTYTRLSNHLANGHLVEPGNGVFDNYRSAFAIGSHQGSAIVTNERLRIQMSGRVETSAPGSATRTISGNFTDGSVILRDSTLGTNNGLFYGFGAGLMPSSPSLTAGGSVSVYAGIKGALIDASNSLSGQMVFSTRNTSSVAMSEKMAIREQSVSIGDAALNSQMFYDIYGHDYVTNTAPPTTALSTGAGTSPTLTAFTAVADSDRSGTITLTTGTTPAANGTVITVTFANPYPVTPRAVLIQGINANTTALPVAAQPIVVSKSTTAFVIQAGTTALAAATPYAWAYVVVA